jgi:small subunit ribosomal protein S15
MPLTQDEKKKLIDRFSQAKGDTGSPEVQAALLTNAIEKLKTHLNNNKQDQPAKRGLLDKISKRRRLLRYLASQNKERYHQLVKKLGLKK